MRSYQRRKRTRKSSTDNEERQQEPPACFSFTLTKVAVSQICRSLGFKAAASSALETLTLVATKYLQELASTAASHSRAANRTESNLIDVTNALNDMSFGQGFPGASTLERSRCMLDSGVLKEIASFVQYSAEIPFAKPIPRNKDANANSNSNSHSVSCSRKENEFDSRSSSLRIPKWLPPFPDEGKPQGQVCVRSEKLWEESELVNVERCVFGGNSDKGEGGIISVSDNLARGREKLRFKFKIGVKEKGNNNNSGVDLRNGVCRGGNRVSWSVGDVIKDDQICEFNKSKRRFN